MPAKVLETRHDGEITIVKLQVESITVGECLQSFESELLGLCDSPFPSTVIVNFQGMEFLCSGAVGALITLNSRLRESDQRLIVCSLQPNVQRIFHLMQLHEVLVIAGDEGEAVKRALNPLT
jgi:anti-anti-sigma factor